MKVQKAAHRSPNTCAFVERFIQTPQQECLDYFVVFGEKHMNHLVSEMVAYYHEERPHQAKENSPLIQASEPLKKRPKGRKASAPPPDSPDSSWVSQQARNFLTDAEDMELAPQIVLRDNDTKFTTQFDAVLKSADVEVKRNTPRSPNLRAHVERFIQTLKVECLDKFVVVAERHLNYVCREWRLHYNRERPHEARGHLPPGFEKPPEFAETVGPNDIVCSSRLGGLLNSYSRRAA